VDLALHEKILNHTSKKMLEEITKFTFSGHDSFPCRQLWLKKGFEETNSISRMSNGMKIRTRMTKKFTYTNKRVIGCTSKRV